MAENKTGYVGVNLNNPGKPKPYLARVRHGGKDLSLGNFATAEEAALCIARSPEGQEAAKSKESRTAKKRPLGDLPALASEEEARQVAAKVAVQSCRAAEGDVMAMLEMTMKATVSEEVRQPAAAQYDTEGDEAEWVDREAEEMLEVLMEAYDARL